MRLPLPAGGSLAGFRGACGLNSLSGWGHDRGGDPLSGAARMRTAIGSLIAARFARRDKRVPLSFGARLGALVRSSRL